MKPLSLVSRIRRSLLVLAGATTLAGALPASAA